MGVLPLTEYIQPDWLPCSFSACTPIAATYVPYPVLRAFTDRPSAHRASYGVAPGANEKLPLAETPPPAAELSTDTETFTAFCAGGASVYGCELEPLAVEPDTGALPAAGADAVAPLPPNGESADAAEAAWPAPSLVCEGASACAWLVPPSGESAACELASDAASGEPVLPAVG